MSQPSQIDPPPLRRNVRFQVLWAGSMVSVLGSHMSALAYPLLILAVTGSPAKAGLVSAAQLLAMVVTALPAGILVDRCDRRRILVTCELVRALAMASVAAAVLTHRVTLTHLLLVALAQGAAGALFGLARLTAIRAVVPAVQLRPALAQDQARAHAAGLAGPFLGGLLFGLGRAIPFVVDAVSYLVSLVCVLAARVPRRPATASRPTTATGPAPARPGLADAVRWLRGRPFLRGVCAFSFATNLAGGGLILAMVVLIGDRGGSPATVGSVMAIAGAGGLLGAALAGRIGGLLAPGRLIAACGWWLAVLVPVMALPFGPLWPGVALAMIMIVLPAIEVTVQTTALAQVPEELQGRITSVLVATNLCAAPLGPLLAGMLIEGIGAGRTLLLQGVFFAVVSAVATFSRTLHRPDESDESDEPAGSPDGKVVTVG